MTKLAKGWTVQAIATFLVAVANAHKVGDDAKVMTCVKITGTGGSVHVVEEGDEMEQEELEEEMEDDTAGASEEGSPQEDNTFGGLFAN